MKYDVFISYSRKDFDEVKPFVDMLHERIPTLDCWFDITGIESGDEFEEKIIKAINNSSYVIFALSGNSLNSAWTKDEVIYARNTGKKVIPLLLEGASLEGWFLFKFGRIDCIDSTSETQVDKLLKDLAKWSGKELAVPAKPKVAEIAATAEPEKETESAAAVIPVRTAQESVPAKTEKPANPEKRNLAEFFTSNRKGLILLFAGLLLIVAWLAHSIKEKPAPEPVVAEEIAGGSESASKPTTSKPATSESGADEAEKRRQAEAEAAEKRRQAEAEAEKRRQEEAKKSNEFVSGKISGHDFVDLGLSVKWATCNVGASKPSNIGDYYAWGELKTKSEYTESNCTTYEQNIEDISGIAKYDVARVKFGAGWRIPTNLELLELVEKCEWVGAVVDNKPGYYVIGPNHKKLFFPVTGCIIESDKSFSNTGYYWSSTQCNQIEAAVYLNIAGDGGDCYPSLLGDVKYPGLCVRPVAD